MVARSVGVGYGSRSSKGTNFQLSKKIEYK